MSQGIRRAPFPTFFRLSHQPSGRRRRPYFSCVCGLVPLGNLSLYSLACVNMSKIFSPSGDRGEYRIRTDDLLHAMQAL